MYIISDVFDSHGRATVKAAILLLPMMGLTWVFGFISLDYGVDALRTLTLIFNIIFIVLNSLQVSESL